MKRTRLLTAVVAATALTVTGLTGAGSPSAAAATTAAAVPVTGILYDLGISGATSMVEAAGSLFIGVGNTVQARDLTGKLLSTISGETGVSDLLVSDDGSTVYAADRGGAAISVIDAASRQETAHWAVSDCPSQLALVSGANRLFYTTGCGASQTIESVDPASGGVPVDSAAGSFDAPLLMTGASGTLAIATKGTSTINTFLPFDPGLSVFTTADIGLPISDLVMSPDGSHIGVASPGATQVNQYEPYSVSQDATYNTGAVASTLAYGRLPGGVWSNQVVVGVDSPTSTRQVFLLDQNNVPGRIRSTYTAATSGAAPLDTVVGTLNIGPDLAGQPNEMSYGLATKAGSTADYLEVGEAATPVPATLSVGVGSPTYGHPLLVAVTFPKHPNMPVTVKVVPNSGPAVYVNGKTNQWAVASLKIPVTASGRVFAFYNGDILVYHDLPAATSILAYTAQSQTAAVLYGSYSTHGGVMYYHSAASVHLHVLMSPPHAVPIRLVLRVYANGIWLVQPAVTFLSNKWGDLEVFLTSATKGVLYQVVVTTPTNVFNTASTATTPIFAIG